MYASVADRGYEGSGGGSGPILIPKRFVWPYGGRRVFLSGSFTRYVFIIIITVVAVLNFFVCYTILTLIDLLIIRYMIDCIVFFNLFLLFVY